MRFSKYEHRICEVCGSNSTKIFESFQDALKNSDVETEIDVTTVCCDDCGFVFMNPSPDENEWERYYTRSLPMYAPADSYSASNRLALLSEFSGGGRVFVEIGGNTPGQFHEMLRERFSFVYSVEINSSCNSDAQTLQLIKLNGQEADVVALYYVLEHITKLNNMLSDIAKVTKAGGILIAEVPDIYEYPHDIRGFLLSEHVNHFSIYTLSKLCARHGFLLKEVSKVKCSRPFGFATVFEKTDKSEYSHAHVERLYAMSCMKAAMALRQVFRQNLNKVVCRLHQMHISGKRVVVWCANKLSNDIMEKYLLAYSDFPFTVIDSDERNHRFFKGSPYVLLPQSAKECLCLADEVIICSEESYMSIATQIQGMIPSFSSKLHYVNSHYEMQSFGIAKESR